MNVDGVRGRGKESDGQQKGCASAQIDRDNNADGGVSLWVDKDSRYNHEGGGTSRNESADDGSPGGRGGGPIEIIGVEPWALP